jgi:Trk K+ transport system NAD-binding subunit
MLQALVKKNAPLIGRSIAEVPFWDQYGVIVVGAELKHKTKSSQGQQLQATTLGEKVLEPGTLLIFTARRCHWGSLSAARCHLRVTRCRSVSLGVSRPFS